MNNQIESPERPATKNSMLLHCGAELADRRAIYEIPTPPGTDTWYPLSHGGLIHEVENQLTDAGFLLTGESHALSHAGARYFGLFEVNTPRHTNRDYTWTVGIRNSHDKSIPAGLVAGSKVLVCDNLSFTGEVKISRKHTRYAQRDFGI